MLRLRSNLPQFGDMRNANSLEAARSYLDRGWRVIPIPRGQKAPKFPEWQNARLTAEELPARFSSGENVGVLLGEPSNWLADVDLDTPESLAVAPFFLPPTGAIFGRPSKPGSHWVYSCPGVNTTQFQTRETGMLVEIRSTGGQTVFPPSLHPSGEVITWHEYGDPAEVTEQELQAAVAKVAAAALLARHWPAPGSRQNAALALAGGLIRGGWTEAEAARFIEAVATAAGDEETRARVKTVLTTARKAGNAPTTGFKTLAGLVGKDVVSTARQWLGISEPAKPQPAPTIVCLADIEPEPVPWLWEPYIPLKKLTILEGDPAAGKTWLALAIAAAVSNGAGLLAQDGRPGPEFEPGNALYLTAEDGLADTLRPRLDALGADARRIFSLQAGETGQAVTLADVGVLDAVATQINPRLIVIDPLQAYLGAGVDMHRANETRPVLSRLAWLAEKHNCAVLVLRHLSKSPTGRAIYRGMGSIDFTAAARSVLLAGADPADPDRRALVQTKNSLAAYGVALGYSIAGSGFFWTGISDLTAEAILSGEGGGRETAIEAAQNFILEQLAEGPRRAKEVERAAKKAKISIRTLKRAKNSLGIVRSKKLGNEWFWELEDGPLEPDHPLKGDVGTLEKNPQSQQPQGFPGTNQECHMALFPECPSALEPQGFPGTNQECQQSPYREDDHFGTLPDLFSGII